MPTLFGYLYLVPIPWNFFLSFKACHWPSDCGNINQAAACWQDQRRSSPLAGSTRQQTVDRINQVVDHGDGDGDEDEDKDEDEDELVWVCSEVMPSMLAT